MSTLSLFRFTIAHTHKVTIIFSLFHLSFAVLPPTPTPPTSAAGIFDLDSSCLFTTKKLFFLFSFVLFLLLFLLFTPNVVRGAWGRDEVNKDVVLSSPKIHSLDTCLRVYLLFFFLSKWIIDAAR